MRTAVFKADKLGAWPFEVAVMEQQRQTTQKLLLAATNERNNLIGTQKTMPVNQSDNLPVAFRKPHGSGDGNASETWVSFVHPAILMADAKTAQTVELARIGNSRVSGKTPFWRIVTSELVELVASRHIRASCANRSR